MNAETPPETSVSDGFLKKNSETRGAVEAVSGVVEEQPSSVAAARELGGRGGLDPTRFGDWEKNGRCIDF